MPKKTPPPTLRTPSTGGTSSTSHTSSVYFSSQNGGLDRHLGKPRCPNCRQKFMSHEMVEIHLENCPVGAADQLEEVKVEEIDKGQQLVEMAQIDAGCHECGRQFQSPRGLKLHKTKMHRRGRPTANPDFFQCSKCPFQSRTKGNLKNHERTHKEYEKTKQNDGDKQHSADQRAMATVVPNSQAASQASRLSAHQKLGRNGGRHSLGPKSSSSSGATFYGQIKHRRAVVGDENEEDDEILEAPQKKKSSGRPRQLIARKQFGAIDSAEGPLLFRRWKGSYFLN